MPKTLDIPESLSKRHKRLCKELTINVQSLQRGTGSVQDVLLLARYLVKLKGSLFRNRQAIIRLKEGLERLGNTSQTPGVTAICEPAIKIIRDILIHTKGTGT